MKNDWASALQEAKNESVDVIPKGFKTVKQIAVELGVSERYANDIVHAIKKKEVQRFRILLSSGNTRSVMHYKLTK